MVAEKVSVTIADPSRTQPQLGSRQLYGSINVASSASAFELLTRFETGQRWRRNIRAEQTRFQEEKGSGSRCRSPRVR